MLRLGCVFVGSGLAARQALSGLPDDRSSLAGLGLAGVGLLLGLPLVAFQRGRARAARGLSTDASASALVTLMGSAAAALLPWFNPAMLVVSLGLALCGSAILSGIAHWTFAQTSVPRDG